MAMKRDIRLDTFRGLFMVWMAVNHLSGPLYAYLFQTLGFVSSAEPFVFISGVTAGLVYGRDIYLFHLATFVFVIILETTISNKKNLVLSILPVKSDFSNALIENYNNQIQSLCNGKNVKFISVYGLFKSSSTIINLKYYLDDGVHLNDAGYQVYAGAIRPDVLS